MRILVLLAAAVAPALAQNPTAQIRNASHPGAEFQIGDRYEVLITGPAGQPVSVRTTNQGRTDWSPVIGQTDAAGRWSAAGQFERRAFGGWDEVWTVGGKLADPVVSFSVGAPCAAGTSGFSQSGPNVMLWCQTAAGSETFGTPSLEDSFRTPDGRVVPGRNLSNQTAAQYRTEILQYLLTSGIKDSGPGPVGDQAAELILTMIGANALTESETRNLLAILRAAFEKPESIPQAAKDPTSTLLLLRRLSDSMDGGEMKRQIVETMAYVMAH